MCCLCPSGPGPGIAQARATSGVCAAAWRRSDSHVPLRERRRRNRSRLWAPPSPTRSRPLPPPGFIDHIGVAVPDIAAAKEYYDDLMSVLGLEEWFATGPDGPLNYGPRGALGTQVFFYQADEPGAYSRGHTGLHHLAFLVATRSVVRDAHRWARARGAVVLDEPGELPQYGEHCYATYWLDPHGFKLEAVCHSPDDGGA